MVQIHLTTKNEINIIGYILFLIKLSGGDGITPAFIILYLLSRYIRNDAYRLFRPWKWLFENMFMKSCSSSRQQSTALIKLWHRRHPSYACVSLRYFYLITIINQFSTDGFFLPVEGFRQEDCSHIHDSTSVPYS